MFIWKSCEENKQLRQEIKQVKNESAELTAKLDQINQKNDSLMLDIVDYENQIVDLEGKLKKAKTRKEIIVDRIKYVEVTNDTIKDLMLLNQINDTIIRNLEMIGTVKDSIIRNQQLVIQNDTVAIDALKSKIEEYRSIIMHQNKEVISERRKKTF